MPGFNQIQIHLHYFRMNGEYYSFMPQIKTVVAVYAESQLKQLNRIVRNNIIHC